MDQAVRTALRRVVSPARFQKYVESCGGDEEAAFRLYRWNIEASAAFWGPVGWLEVALRNALHDRLSEHCGRPDWWTAISLQKWAREEVGRVEREAAKRGRQPTPDRTVAGLSFGFWVSLLGSGGKGGNYEMRLWRPALRTAFPGWRGTRKDLHSEFDYVRTFRNRIAHQEPIHHRHLEADHDTVLRLIGLVCPITADYVARDSPVPGVLRRRPGG